MKTNISLFGSVSALLLASVFLQGCRTYQPGVSTRRTLFSTPEQSYTPVAQPAPAAVHTTPATVKPARETVKSVATPRPAPFAPVAVETKQPMVAPSVHTVAPNVPASTRLSPKTAERPIPTAPVVAPATASQLTHALNYRIHTVQPGEFAGKIANDNGMTLKEFTELNKIADPNHLRVGQTVKIAVGRKALAAGPATPAPAVSVPGKVHVVAAGESLSVIAARTGVSEKELVAINGIKDPNRIRVGQKLRLTRGEAAAPVAPAAAVPATTPKDATPTATPATTTKAATPVVAPVAPVEPPVAVEATKDDLVPGTNASVEDLLNGKVSLMEARSEAEKKAQEAKAAAEKVQKDAAALAAEGQSGVKTREYIVERADEDLYSIALKFGSTVYELRKHNPTLSRKPAVGTKVIIPEKTDL